MVFEVDQLGEENPVTRRPEDKTRSTPKAMQCSTCASVFVDCQNSEGRRQRQPEYSWLAEHERSGKMDDPAISSASCNTSGLPAELPRCLSELVGAAISKS